MAASSVASRHSTLSDRMRTGPVSSMRTGRQIPPGFQSGSMQSQCWKMPVRLRLAVRSVGRVQATSTASRWSGRARERGGHLEGVGKEVPLGVAEVLAVQPDVALVEDAVEGQKPAPRRAPAPGPRTGGGRGSARRSRRTPDGSASGPGR